MSTKRRTWAQDEVAQLQSDESYQRGTFDGLSLKHIDFSNSEFTSCSFRAADLTNARLNGCSFTDCDLSSCKLAGANLFSAQFEGCKLLGVNLADSTVLTAVKFKRCNFDYCNLRGLSLENMRFNECSFIEADLSLTRLKKTVFLKCNLERVDWQEAGFEQTDLRGSQLTGLNLRQHNLKGAILSTDQAAELARELGIQIV